MKRKITNIILFVPIVLLMLHSVVPHHHLDDIDDIALHSSQCQTEFEIFDFLFQVDPGENHLEEFQVEKIDIQFEVSSIKVLDLLVPEHKEEDEYLSIPTHLGIPKRIIVSNLSLRAPPAFV